MPIKSLSASSLVNFQKYSSMLAGNDPFDPTAYSLLDTELLSSTQASVTLNNLASLYSNSFKHLQLRITGRSSRGSSSDGMGLTINSATSYYVHRMRGYHSVSTATSDSYTSATILACELPGNTTNSGVFGGGIVDIFDAFNSNKNTTVRTQTTFVESSSNCFMYLASGLYATADVLDSLEFVSVTGNSFLPGTRISLYGLKGE